MALEMKVHKDIAAVEAKPMWGLTWRQLLALVVMTVGGGGVFVAVTLLVLTSSGHDWSDLDALKPATTAGMYAMFPILIPAAAWAWWRPMGLKPEIYAQYMFRHQHMPKDLPYEDSYAHRTARVAAGDAGDEPVPDGGFLGRIRGLWRRLTARAFASRRRGDVSERPSA